MRKGRAWRVSFASRPRARVVLCVCLPFEMLGEGMFFSLGFFLRQVLGSWVEKRERRFGCGVDACESLLASQETVDACELR